MSKDGLYAIFAQANQAFDNANVISGDTQKAERLYGEAILGYEKVIDEFGIKNPGLYYNLANAYFLKGDIGRAILNYRRGERLDPGNADIHKNLAFARSNRIDKIELKAREKVLKTLLFWHYDFSIKTRFLLACITFAVACLALTFLLWRGRNNFIVTTAAVCGVIFICLFGSVVLSRVKMASRTCGVVVAGEVIARQGDGENYMPSFKEPLHAGTEFELLESRDSWLHIKLADESQAWIETGAAELI